MLDEASARLIATLAAAGLPPVHELSPEQARAAGEEHGRAVRPGARDGAHRGRRARTADGGRSPRVLVPRERARGVIVYYHGGGWVIGDLDQFDALARRLADRTGCAVVLVDYRLAPEHRFPAAVEDAWTALQWVADHVEEIAGARGPADRRGRQRRREPRRRRGAARRATRRPAARAAGARLPGHRLRPRPTTPIWTRRTSCCSPARRWGGSGITTRPTRPTRTQPGRLAAARRRPCRAAAGGGPHRRVRRVARRGRGLRRRLARGGRAASSTSASPARCTASSRMRGPRCRRAPRRLELIAVADRLRPRAGREHDQRCPSVRRRRRRRRASPGSTRCTACARSGLRRAGVRAGRRRRRHLVLEPLPGRALRHRVAATTRTRSPRSSSRSGSGASAIPPSRRSCATSTTSPTASTCGATSSSRTRVSAARYDEDSGRWHVTHRRRRALFGARYCVMAAGCLSTPSTARTFDGLDDFEGEWYHTRPLAARTASTLAGKRVGVIGTGSTGIQLDPAARRAGGAPVRVPADAELQHARAATGPLDPDEPARGQGRLPRAPAARARVAQRRAALASGPAAAALGARGRRPRSAGAPTRTAGRAAASAPSRSRSTTSSRTPRRTTTAADFVRDKIREIVARPGDRGRAVPDHAPDRHQAHLRRHRLLRDLQPRQRHARRRPRATRSCAITPRGVHDRRARVRARRRSCSPPASTR